MSPFAKLMLRFGWIRLSTYGLEMTLDGRVVPACQFGQSSFDNAFQLAAPSVDPASVFDPSLAQRPAPSQSALAVQAPAPTQSAAPARPARPLPPIPSSRQAAGTQAPPVVQTQPQPVPASVAAANELSQAEEEDEWAWQAAVAKARAEEENTESDTEIAPELPALSDEEAGFADTAPLRRTSIVQPTTQQATQLATESQASASADEEPDWEALMAAARARAESEAQEADTEDTICESTCVEMMPDFAAAQVEPGAHAANDDLPADTVTSINAIKLRTLPTQASEALRAAEEQKEADEWAAMRKQVEAKENEERARKLRAMREIRRLQGRSPLPSLHPSRPPLAARRRIAAGTAAPTGSSQSVSKVLMPLRPLTPTAVEKTEVGGDTSVDLPRVTSRLSR